MKLPNVGTVLKWAVSYPAGGVLRNITKTNLATNNKILQFVHTGEQFPEILSKDQVKKWTKMKYINGKSS